MKRATNMSEFKDVRQKITDLATISSAYLKNYNPKATDVIISPFSKSGTTWLQQIVHGMRTRGSMDFDEITDVTPWIEWAQIGNWDVNQNQVSNPRVYKSHLSFHEIPKGAKYICSFRDPDAQLLSFYRFLEGWWFEKGSLGLEEFADFAALRDPKNSGYWHHLSSWWDQKNNDNVLLLCFEDMIADFSRTINKLANFLEIDLDDELREILENQSSKSFMLEHKSQFDDHNVKSRLEELGGPPFNEKTSKITSGMTSEEKYLISESLRNKLDKAWQSVVFDLHGLVDYHQLRTQLNDAKF